MERYNKYFIKIISAETKIYDGKEFKVVLAIEQYISVESFKKGYKELLKKYGNHKNEILTYQRVRGRWYECPKPKT